VSSSHRTGPELVAALERWEALGGTWQVAHRSVDTVTVSMCRCDGGEEAERFTSDARELLSYLGARTSSSPT